MLILHIRQSIYLVLTNVLSASFVIVHITFDEIPLQLQSTNISLLHMYRVHLSLPELYSIHVEQYVRTLELYLCYFLRR